MTTKIKIGISACLLGKNVRYDGGHKLDPRLMDTLGQVVEWAPVCPEVEAGLSVPREAMQLVSGPDAPRLVTIETRIDHTGRMTHWVRRELVRISNQGLSGFVFKARSPSCGVRDAEIVTSSGRSAGRGAGLFAAAVAARFPALPVEDEGRLQDPVVRKSFLERAFAHRPRPGEVVRIDFREG
jgi:uncharacterized protein YbbK (DUF523 family)